MDAFLPNTPDLMNESVTNTRIRKTGTSPHHQQSASYMVLLIQLGTPEVCWRVLEVLKHMESLHLNLPILLWALSWNDSYPDLVSNDKAHFARMALTTSELLPGILKIWHHPPHVHNCGV
jgi:hypothetical protein